MKVEGKTTYPTEYSLDFLREGDTYTLRSVDGTSVIEHSGVWVRPFHRVEDHLDSVAFLQLIFKLNILSAVSSYILECFFRILEETQIFEAIPLPVSPYQSLTLDRFNVLELQGERSQLKAETLVAQELLLVFLRTLRVLILYRVGFGQGLAVVFQRLVGGDGGLHLAVDQIQRRPGEQAH